MFSERTQVLLSKQQLAALKQRARHTKKSLGAVIRDAVDAYVEAPSTDDRRAAFARLIAMELPVDDWPVMKAQIEQNRLHEIEQSLLHEQVAADDGAD